MPFLLVTIVLKLSEARRKICQYAEKKYFFRYEKFVSRREMFISRRGICISRRGLFVSRREINFLKHVNNKKKVLSLAEICVCVQQKPYLMHCDFLPK